MGEKSTSVKVNIDKKINVLLKVNLELFIGL